MHAPVLQGNYDPSGFYAGTINEITFSLEFLVTKQRNVLASNYFSDEVMAEQIGDKMPVIECGLTGSACRSLLQVFFGNNRNMDFEQGENDPIFETS